MKGNCFIDIDGIYDYQFIIGLLKVGFFVGVHWMEFADTTLGISEQYLFFCQQTGMVGH